MPPQSTIAALLIAAAPLIVPFRPPTPQSAAPSARRAEREAQARARAAAYERSLLVLEGAAASVMHPPGESAARGARALLRRREDAWARMSARVLPFLTVSAEPPKPICFVWFPSLETRVTVTGVTEEAGSDPGRPDRVPVVEGDVPAIEDLAHARAVARALLGERGERRAALEWGLAVHLIGGWKGEPTARAAGRLSAAEVLPALYEILSASEDGPEASSLLLAPAAGSLVDYAVSRVEPRRFLAAATAVDPGRALARAIEPQNEDLSALESGWRASLVRPPARSRRSVPPGFQRGVCLAHTNSPSRGYGGDAIGRTLDMLVSQGVDWISVTPFGFQRTLRSESVRYVLRGGGSETDEAMRHVVREARARGLRVLYKPHIWVGGHGTWCGDIAMGDEAGWASWFASYRRFIVHHALLAEEEGADILSVGNELGGTTRRAADWRKLIAAVRGVFGGGLTYAANWGEEAERVAFWDALDFVGVNEYYPLSSDLSASDDDLLAGARRVAARVVAVGRRAGRPLLLTEIGFASRPACWKDPHQEIRTAAADTAAQARSYRAALHAFVTDTGTPVRGLYWWKLESDPSIGGSEDASFTPRAKPAEEEMSAVYRAVRSGAERAGTP